jgi:hypothetical protein
MSKITDKDIIEALECCISAESCCECGYTKICDGTTIHQFALALINRLKADVIHYRRKAQNQKQELSRLNTEIERLKKGWKADVIETQNIKSEAIKEFAERLKTETFLPKGSVEHAFLKDDIDNLVKEMVGEGK